MGEQINVRLSGQMLLSAKDYAKANGFDNVQELIKETLREKLFETSQVSSRELTLIKKLVQASEKSDLYGTEKELFRKLRRK
ncbi:MAG: hypothetical protein V1866_01095 [archaeon]